MPKFTRDHPLSSNGSKTTPYDPSAVKTTKRNLMLKLARSIDMKDMEEAKCSICMETPHLAVILQCSGIEKGCHSYMCNTSKPHSNCFSRFCKSPTSIDSIPTLLCPLCGGEVKSWFVIAGIREFMNSVPRSCSVETCEFSGNYPELVEHLHLDHPLVPKPKPVKDVRLSVPKQIWMKRERDRELAEKGLFAFYNDLESALSSDD